MPAYVETLPPDLDACIRQTFTPGETLEAAVSTDIRIDGTFGVEWIVLTNQSLRIFPESASSPRLILPLTDISRLTGESLVGGGAWIASTPGGTLEIIRYRNAQRTVFGKLAAYLSDGIRYRAATARGEPPGTPPVLTEEAGKHKRCPTCRLLLPEATSVCPICLDKGKVLRRLIAYLKPQWEAWCLVWALMFAGLAVHLVPPYLTRPLMDRVLVPTGIPAPTAERLTLLGWLVLGLLLSQAAGNIIGIVRTRLLIRLGTRLSHNLRVQLFRHIQFLSLRFFDKRPVGAIITRITQDTASLEQVLVDGMQHFVVNILTLVGIGIVLAVMNWRLTLLVLIPVPIVLFLSRTIWHYIHGRWHRFWHYRSRLTATVSDTLSGMRVVKAFAKEREEIDRFTRHSNELLIADTDAEQTTHTLFPILWFITSTGALLVWYFGGRQVIGGALTIGTLMTFQAYLGMFYGPLQFLSRMADFLARSLTSAERVFEILDTVPEVRDSSDAVPMPAIRGRVEFCNITFGYESFKPAIRNLTLDVQPGEMIGLVGHSGAGKSTTINLLCRLFDVNEGEIRVDGVDIRRIRQEDLRSQIGVVLQDTFLFNGTVAENIAYAKPDASPAEIMAAAKMANAHDFIVSKADGYDTRVGERGQQLSSGERQRVAIARAILHNPRILILDEATASVDTETERQIQEAIARLIRGRTTFAIAHRLSTLRNANRLLVLKKGEVAEIGTHEELIAKNGEFAKMVEAQKALSSIMEVGR